MKNETKNATDSQRSSYVRSETLTKAIKLYAQARTTDVRATHCRKTNA